MRASSVFWIPTASDSTAVLSACERVSNFDHSLVFHPPLMLSVVDASRTELESTSRSSWPFTSGSFSSTVMTRVLSEVTPDTHRT
jgi:hypothetical protein